MAMEVPKGVLSSTPSPIRVGSGLLAVPPATITFRYHFRPPLYPPLIWSTILSSPRSTLVTWTVTPARAAGPLSMVILAHWFLSTPVAASNSSGVLERGSTDLVTAYSAMRPRVSSTRSSKVSLRSEEHTSELQSLRHLV